MNLYDLENEEFFTRLRMKQKESPEEKYIPIVRRQDLRTVSDIKDIRKEDLLLLSFDHKLTPSENFRDVDILQKPEFVLAYVTEKAGRNNWIEVLVDPSKETYQHAFVYPLTSLVSSTREYKTIRMSEFSRYSDTLLHPKQAYISSHQRYGDFHECKNVNESQKQILQKVQTLNNYETMLIQGPPGTGKTKTIVDIITILLKKLK